MRTGILGGTFDPIHIGHLYIADAVRDHAGLDRVLFVPIAAPAHRDTHASPNARRAMTELAIQGNPLFSFDQTGLDQPAPAYTADTLTMLRAKHPDDALSFIAGIDSLARSRWRRLDEVVTALDRFYVVVREGVDRSELDPILAGLPHELERRFELIDAPMIDVSSTSIRALVAAGRSIRYLVPDAVAKYIQANELYKM